MAADKIIRNSKLDTFLSKLATKLASIFWRKAETTQVGIDDTPTANSNNLVKSRGVYDAIKALNNGNAVIVTSLPVPSASTRDKLYYVGPDTDNQYERFFTSYDGSVYSWVSMGNTAINLETYVTDEELSQLLLLEMGYVEEDGIFFVDSNLNIGVKIGQDGYFAINSLTHREV